MISSALEFSERFELQEIETLSQGSSKNVYFCSILAFPSVCFSPFGSAGPPEWGHPGIVFVRKRWGGVECWVPNDGLRMGENVFRFPGV